MYNYQLKSCLYACLVKIYWILSLIYQCNKRITKLVLSLGLLVGIFSVSYAAGYETATGLFNFFIHVSIVPIRAKTVNVCRPIENISGTEQPR